MLRASLITAVFLGASLHPASAAELPRANAPCSETADPTRWSSVGAPDTGANPPLISAHRGAIKLAPENTIFAYRHAFAYEADFVEVDVRESLDGVFYSLHDSTVDRTTDGTGELATMTSLQIDALNAADFEPWKGSEYDPARITRLEDVLALARDAGKGIEFDIKFVKNYPLLFQLAQQYGVATRSYHNMSGDPVTLAQTLDADVRVIFNIEGTETPQALYDETGRSVVYGSRRDKFTAEKIAAIHDGCSVVIPHTYDEGHENEAAEFLLARAAGADGAQTDQPDVIRAAMGAPVATQLAPDAAQGANAVCLTNAGNQLGLPYKLVSVTTRRGVAVATGITNRFGCIELPGAPTDYVVRFAGDGSAKKAQHNTPLAPPGDALLPPPAAVPALPVANVAGAGRFGGALGLSLLPLLLVVIRRWHRAIALPLVLSIGLAACGDTALPAAGPVTTPVPAPVVEPSPTTPPAVNPSKSLRRAHAHNDYEHTRPLLDALDAGFTSVEADVYVAPLPAATPGAIGNQLGLYVAHDPQDIRPENTLAALYLEPLKMRIAENGGCVQKDCAPFYLLIDAKTEGETTYAAIEAELAKYDTLFVKYFNGGLRDGPVLATLSGNRPKATMAAATSRYTFYDGRFSDLDSNDPVTLIPLISDSWTTHFGWDGNGTMPADQKAKLLEIMAKSHAKGRRVRLYAVPDAAGAARENLWRELLAAGQDHLNTDDLAGLRAFLLANDPDQRQR